MSRRILLVGATGVFGARLAARLADWPDITLVIAARRLTALESLRRALGARAADIEVAVFDRRQPERLAALRPWAVVDAAGPFQAGDLALARAAVAAGAHYVDIADARDFVARFPGALDGPARATGVWAVTGASSTPALSNAALDAITEGWRRIDSITVAISPGARAPRGLSVVQAILSYAGRPVRVFQAGRWRDAPGWGLARPLEMEGLGRRWVGLCETPDLDILPARFAVQRQALFLAGVEPPAMQLGLWLLTLAVRARLVASLRPLAPALRAAAGLFAPFGDDRGGMLAEAEGLDAEGRPIRARWSLWAEPGAGPNVPVAAAAAVLRRLKDDPVPPLGAEALCGAVGLDAILAELAGLPIHTRTDAAWPEAPGVFTRALGPAFAGLPASVAELHGRPGRFVGRAAARGSRGLLARLMRRVIGLPPPGLHPAIGVDIVGDATGETWTRRFGAGQFRSRLVSLPEPGRFEERFGLLSFRFAIDARPDGLRWRFLECRLGPLRLPRVLSPRIRARAFARDGVYRFSQATALPLVGLLFAYAGRLRPAD